MSTKSSTKVQSYSSPGGTTRVSSSSYSSSSGRSTRPISQAKGRYSMGSRRSMGPVMYGGGGGSMITRTVEYGVSSAPGALDNVAASNVNQLLQNRSHEKKDMQDLNERLASYIEKVRFLEAQNKKLAADLADLQSKWGKETQAIKDRYEVELKELRDLRDDAEKEKEKLAIQVDRLTENLEEANDKIENLQRLLDEEREASKQKDTQISDYVAELELLRKRIDSLERERAEDKAEIERLQNELLKARSDLDNEMLGRIDAENRCQSLMEEIEFMKRCHDNELKEMQALICKDTTADNRKYWNEQLQRLLRELTEEYDRKVDNVKNQLESFYNVKMQEYSTAGHRKEGEVERMTEINRQLQRRIDDQAQRLADVEAELAKYQKMYGDAVDELERKQADWDVERNELKAEIAALRQSCADLAKRVETMCDAKLSLELEIAAYRTLLSGEESRLDSRDREYSSYSHGYGGDSDLQQVMKGEMQAKTTYARTAKGPVSISATGKMGDFVEVENTGREDVRMDGYSIRRDIDGKSFVYNIPGGIVLSKKDTPGNKMRFYKRGGKDNDRKNSTKYDIDSDLDSWGMGANIATVLLNEKKEERATHTAKTVFTT